MRLPRAFATRLGRSAAVLAHLTAPQAALAQPAAAEFDLPVVAGAVQGLDGDTLRVRQGDALRLSFTSDAPIELHLHGYDLIQRVAPGAASVLALEAAIAGRFPVTVHEEGGVHRPGALMYLEVHP